MPCALLRLPVSRAVGLAVSRAVSLAVLGLSVVAVSGTAATLPARAGEAAAPVGQIRDLAVTGDRLSFVYYSSDLSGAPLDPGSVQVSVDVGDGEPVPLAVQASLLADQTQQVTQTAVLVVDTSGSLASDGIEAVKAAATQFLQTVPPQVEVGLVTFGNPPVVVVAPPTADRQLLQGAVDSLVSEGNTALYDAVVEGVELLPGEGTERIVLLTDGEDDSLNGGPGTDNTVEEAIAAVDLSGATLTAVAFRNGTSQDELTRLAEAGRGQVVNAADPAALDQAFADVADSISQDLRVEADIPPELAGQSGNVVVTVQAGEETLQTQAYLTVPGAQAPSTPPEATAPPPVDSSGPAIDRRALYAGVGSLFLAALIVAVVVVGLIRRRSSDEVMRSRNLALYSMRRGARDPQNLAGQQGPTTRLGGSAVARSAVELAGRVVARRDSSARLAKTLEAADVPLRPGEWVILHVGIALGVALLLLLLSAGNPLAILIGLVLGAVTPWLYVGLRTGRRKSAFLKVLPDTLGLMANGLRAGYSLPQAMDSVAREGQEPLRGEVNRALVESQLGVAPEDALESIAERMDSQDFRWVVMAIRIQREVGGNLAELLDTVAATMRERARLRRQVDVLSAEGRLSAWIVGLLPVAFTLYLLVARPSYLIPLYTEPLGIVLVSVGLALFVAGVLGLRWAVKVHV